MRLPATVPSRLCWLACLALAGCGQSSDTPRFSPQALRLKDIRDREFVLHPEQPGDWPIRFHVGVNQRGRRDAVTYEGVLFWESMEERDRMFEGLVRPLRFVRPDLPAGKIKDFTVRLEYRYPGSSTADREEVVVPSNGLVGNVPLPSYCLNDAPESVKLEVVAATWAEPEIQARFVKQDASDTAVEDGKLTPQAPAGLPLRFDGLKIDAATARTLPAQVGWRLSADRAALRARVAAVTEPNTGLEGRDLKSLTFKTIYRDGKGKLLGSDDVPFDLAGDEGQLALTRLDRPDLLGRLLLTPLTATWRERTTVVPLTEKDR